MWTVYYILQVSQEPSLLCQITFSSYIINSLRFSIFLSRFFIFPSLYHTGFHLICSNSIGCLSLFHINVSTSSEISSCGSFPFFVYLQGYYKRLQEHGECLRGTPQNSYKHRGEGHFTKCGSSDKINIDLLKYAELSEIFNSAVIL